MKGNAAYAGLDQQGKKWLEEVLLDFKGKGGAVLMATHSFGCGSLVEP
ncbi:MAG: hypothetical protein HYY64_12980 [Candidatus Rokubacteria bacterium]|nr:hypothetical protein [Candidatus Rokubacteria bacterium]